MTRCDGIGVCQSCDGQFEYMLIHNGFNESAYAYCDSCGRTALLDGWEIPNGVHVALHRELEPSVEALLQPCACGGAFKGSATPRCPHCSAQLSAERAARWIEASAPGTQSGWQWQRSWRGLYCIVVNGQLVKDNWRSA